MISIENGSEKPAARAGQRISGFYGCDFVKFGKSYFLKKSDGKHQRIILNIGPHWPGVVVTLALIFVGTRVNMNIADGIAHGDETKLVVMYTVIVIFCIATTVSLILTAFSDCGVLLNSPVSSDDEAAYDGTYCDICDIFQPSHLQVHHCTFCDVCIVGHDHHCPWMGKCVGRKNMRYFIIFNVCWVLYLIELFVLAFGFV